MNKSKKLPIIIALILLGVLAAAAIGLFIAETAHNAWVVDKADAVKFGILMVGIGLTLVRLIGNVGGYQFFIPQEKMRARDFSDVMYTWDCG